eukprot:m.112933 g.112933  ORF g.112933 m.112933 type:complete len:723 (-) comp12793_c0_seq3:1631-3799(-)
MSEEEAVRIVVDAGANDQVVSILAAKHRKKNKPYANVKGSLRSENEHEHGRDPHRTVRIVIPPDHEQKRNKRVHSVARRPKRAMITMTDILQIYRQSCASQGCVPLKNVVEQLKKGKQGKEEARSLVIKGEKLSHESVLSLCEIIRNNHMLRNIQFSDAGLTDESISSICKDIMLRRCCSKLNFSENKIGYNGIAAVTALLPRNFLLNYLNLSGIVFTKKMAQTLATSLPRSKLHTLIMHRCGLHDTGVLGSITAGCSSCSTLLNISFKSNNIPSAGGKLIARPLKRDQFLECLDLRCNKLGDKGITDLCVELGRGGAVRKLVLFDNHITHAGIRKLSRVLVKNTTLESLDLSRNPIGHYETILSLKQVLCGNTTLRNLFLWNVDMRDEGAVLLAEILAENKSLQRLEIRQNSIGIAGLMAFKHTVALNSKIFKLLIDIPLHRNSGEEDTIHSLYTSIQQHCAQNLAAITQPPEDHRQANQTRERGADGAHRQVSDVEGEDAEDDVEGVIVYPHADDQVLSEKLLEYRKRQQATKKNNSTVTAFSSSPNEPPTTATSSTSAVEKKKEQNKEMEQEKKKEEEVKNVEQVEEKKEQKDEEQDAEEVKDEVEEVKEVEEEKVEEQKEVEEVKEEIEEVKDEVEQEKKEVEEEKKEVEQVQPVEEEKKEVEQVEEEKEEVEQEKQEKQEVEEHNEEKEQDDEIEQQQQKEKEKLQEDEGKERQSEA